MDHAGEGTTYTALLYSRSLPLVPGLFCGISVRSVIMGDIPAAQYCEQAMDESHETTETAKSEDPSLDLRLSVHLANG